MARLENQAVTILWLVALLLTGCQALIYGTASDFNRLSLGMSKDDVLMLLGTPIAASADATTGEESFIYKRMKHAISEWPRTYIVTFKDGKLIRFGEQYHEENINVYPAPPPNYGAPKR